MTAPTPDAAASAAASDDERRLPFENAPNFRDFGGYSTADGRQVVRGRLFRSGQLADLNAHDLALFERLRIRVVCDFRRAEEVSRQPSRLPSALVPVSLPITPGSLVSGIERGSRDNPDSETLRPQDMADIMCAINGELALEQAEAYRAMFGQLSALEDGGILIHCAAGKDRTGFGAAIILIALGVERDTVMHDYMLTARYTTMAREANFVKRKYRDYFDDRIPLASVMPMLEAREAYLNAAFDAIASRYHSMESYLTQCLGVDAGMRERLREQFLTAG